MATIKAIEGRSVHQIQSGQVIVDLNSVAKELVENALDAGATSIEVRFKNNGLDSIEVQDNGSGIAPEDYDTIALKHYTSKLSTYDDLGSLTTFGFRGEALSSLCALSKFHIVTARAADGPKGTKLEFETSGKIKGKSVVAAKQGTIVVVDSLFYNLPVRKKELEKTIKREYSKVLALLHAYACISVGVKFSVSNLMPKGKKTVAFATNSNPNTKENIANVYGAKTLLALIPLDLKFQMVPSNRPGATQSARNWSTHEDLGAREVQINGYISRPVVGEGRQTPDRQMFFVNSRPCELPQVKKAFNEVYKSFNITQSPFIFADIKLDTNAYDVNVSPDKRSILLHDQTVLLENLKNSLAELFEAHDQSVPQAQLPDRKLSSFRPPMLLHRESTNWMRQSQTPPHQGVGTPDIHDAESQARETIPHAPHSPEERPRLGGFIKASLIERFAERDAAERVYRQAERQKTPVVPEKRKISMTFAEDDSQTQPLEMDVPAPDLPARHERSESPLFEPESEEIDTPQQLPKPVQDFNARLASQQAKRFGLGQSPTDEEYEQEEPIRAIKQTSQRSLSQSTLQNAFDRMRPMRTPVQQATITIGDKTTVSTIGSQPQSTKRARVHTPKFLLNGTAPSQTTRKPLILNSLRAFAASETQMTDLDEEEQEDEEREDDQDSPMPDAPAYSSASPRKGSFSGAMDPTTEELEQDSSDMFPIPPPATDKDKEQDEKEVDLDGPPPNPPNESDHDYIDESEKKAGEEAKIAKMIAEAEETAARPSELNLKRAAKLMRVSTKKYQTIGLIRDIPTSVEAISSLCSRLASLLSTANCDIQTSSAPPSTPLEPEERLSLTVQKFDFARMTVIGQFNLGFILAVRPPSANSPTADLFIIDQHASDEKYNFERLSSTTVLVSQRLVRPHPLELTAIEEEAIQTHQSVLAANGFAVVIDTSGDLPVGQRAKLTSLPMSKEITFTPADLEELLVLLDETPTSTTPSATEADLSNSTQTSPLSRYIPRPSKVRKLLASRACRSSIMVGKTLKVAQMEKVVRHMGEMDKPWSCPHGRPTMRHLFGLEKWEGWKEGDGVMGLGGGEESRQTDWGAYLQEKRKTERPQSADIDGAEDDDEEEEGQEQEQDEF